MPAGASLQALAEEHAAPQVEHAPVVPHLTPLDRQGLALDGEAEPAPVGRDEELGHAGEIGGGLVGAGEEGGRPRGARPFGDGAAAAHVAVGEGEQRLDLVLARHVEARLLDDPGGVARGHEVAGHAALERELARDHLAEAVRPSPEEEDRRRRAGGLGPHRDHDRALHFGHGQHAVVAPLEAGDGPELVPGDEHVARGDAERSRDVVEHEGHGVGLVGEADLDVLHVAGDARVGEAHLARHALGHGERLAHAVAEAGAAEPRLDRHEQLAQRALRRIAEGGLGDEVDLATVEAGADDGEGEAGDALQALPHPVDDEIEEAILLRRGLPPVEQDGASAAIEAEHLGAAVGAHEETARVLRRHAAGELRRHVVEARARDHGEADAGAEEAIEQVDDGAGVGGARRDRGSIPVERDQTERAIELVRQVRGRVRASTGRGAATPDRVFSHGAPRLGEPRADRGCAVGAHRKRGRRRRAEGVLRRPTSAR